MKLVRDLIPQIIEDSGNSCSYHQAEGDELKQRLYEKMAEELNEFIENPCIEEAADMWEVLQAIFYHHDLHQREVMNAAEDKCGDRGAFDLGIVLESIGQSENLRHLDESIKSCVVGYEEEIELYKTYGGD